MSLEDRLLYIDALGDGVALQRSILRSKGLSKTLDAQAGDVLTAANLTLGDLEKELTRLYSDPANAIIPVPFMYWLSMDIFKGATQDHQEQTLLRWRRASTSSN